MTRGRLRHLVFLCFPFSVMCASEIEKKTSDSEGDREREVMNYCKFVTIELRRNGIWDRL
jgi:hypothetical protein